MGASRLPAEGEPLGGDVRSVARVLRRVDDDEAVRIVELVRVDLRERAELLLGRFGHPGRVGGERVARERVGAAPSDLAHDLLDERAAFGRRAHEHLPAGLHVDAALDEERGIALDAWIGHRSCSLSRRS